MIRTLLIFLISSYTLFGQWIMQYNPAGSSAIEDIDPPSAPFNFIFIATGTTTATGTWNDPSDEDLDSIRVYLNGNWIASIAEGVQTYNFTGLVINQTDTAWVAALDDSSNLSAISNSDTTTTYDIPAGGTVPNPVTSLFISDSTGVGGWNIKGTPGSPSNTTGYIIYRSGLAYDTIAPPVVPALVSYLYETDDFAVQETFYIKAYNAIGQSTESNSVVGQRLPTVNRGYFGSLAGNANNTGKYTNQTWTLAKIKTTTFTPGDTVLLKCGDSWIDQWTINFSGNVSNRIYIGNYGSGVKPTFNGNSTLSFLIKLNPNISYITLDGLKFIDINNSANYSGHLFLAQKSNNIEVTNCYFSQVMRGTLQTNGMIVGLDVHHIDFTNNEATGRMQWANLIANYQDSHNDVHHILYDNNYIHHIWVRVVEGMDSVGAGKSYGMWFQQWFSTNPDQQGFPGTVLGQEGTYRDITITNNRFDSLQTGAIYWYRDKHFYSGWRLSGGTTITGLSHDDPLSQPPRQGYNWIISDNDFNLCEGASAELAPISNRYGVNHPETGVPIGWSIISGNRIDSSGYNYVTKNPTHSPGSASSGNATSGIETHGWKQVYIEDNYITYSTSNNGDGHAINFDFSPSFASSTWSQGGNGQYIPCDSLVVRRNIIAYHIENMAISRSSTTGALVFTTTHTVAAIHFAVARKGNEVYDNIIYECNYGLRPHSWSLGDKHTAINTKIFNNTIFKCDIGIQSSSSGNWSFDPSWQIKNNIISYCEIGWRSQPFANTTPAQKTNNLWFGNAQNFSGPSGGTNDLFTNPLFADTLNKDFRLQTGSPAINSGVNVTVNFPTIHEIQLDYFLGPRKVGGLFDIGYDERD